MDIQLYQELMSNLGRWRKHERWSRPQLEAYQAESLHRMREWTYARSPFYQRFHKGLEDSPLQELPVLTKAMMMENFDELVTDRAVRLEDVRVHLHSDGARNRFLNRYWVTTTSRRPDRPGIHLFNRNEWAAVLASAGRVREWAGWATSLNHMLHRMPLASLGSASPWHMGQQIAKTLNSLFPMNQVMPMRNFDVSQPLTEIVRQLNEWQPHWLSGNASMMGILADEQLAGHLAIHPHWIAPDTEVLTDEIRRCIEAAWGHGPFNAFWATAGGYLASERSDHNGLYLFEDNVIFESVDEIGRAHV